MKMKKFLLTAAACMIAGALGAQAQTIAGKKIYLNPGHGGYDATPGIGNDRWVATIPYPKVCEEGVWESKHNLWRGLELRRLLEKDGAIVMMSRVENRPEDDRNLESIGQEATTWGADMFLSIHSNANGANHMLTIFRGADPRPGQPFDINDPDLPESKVMAEVGWRHLQDNHLTCWQARKNATTPYAVADSAFYSGWTEGYHLGVLRKMWRPGYLAEIAFHDYKPESHRCLSEDYSKIIAYKLYLSILDYFKAPMPKTGIIAGEAKDGKRILRDPLFLGASFGDHDQYKPLNGAKVTLTGQGITREYTTDNNYNGLFYFPDLEPGTYPLSITADGYTTYEEDVTCQAAAVTGPIALMDDPSYNPNDDIMQPAVYASGLSAVGNNTIRFTLNADALSVTINFIKDGNIVKSADLGSFSSGTHTVTVPNPGLEEGSYSWSLTANGPEMGITEPKQFTTNGDPRLEIANIRGIAVDNSFESPYFGRVYATSIEANGKKGARMGTGIYVFDAALTDVTGQGEQPYKGGIAWSGNSSPMRPAVAPDGRVFICDWSDGHSGIWIMDPANPSEPFKELFTGGSRNGDGLRTVDGAAVHGSIPDLFLTGTGEDLKLYVNDEDYPESFINRYDLGTAETWSKAPSQCYGNHGGKLVNSNQSISSDGHGGVWVGQYRYTNSNTYPVMLHINGKTGQYDCIVGSTAIFGGSNPVGATGVNYDGSLIAVGNQADIRVAQVTYDENGTPTVSLKYSIGSTYGSRPFKCAFDRANNLYVAYNDNAGGIAGFVLPNDNNSFTTPANDRLSLAAGITDVEADSNGILYDGRTVSAAGTLVEVFTTTGAKVAEGYSIDMTGFANGVYVVRAGSKSLKITF